MGTLKTTNIQTITGSGTLTLGTSGETLALGSGVTSNLMYPAFQVSLSTKTTITSGVATKAPFDTEIYDTDNCYDNTTNYRFTPTVAGKYFIYANIGMNANSASNLNSWHLYLYKNGSIFKRAHENRTNNPGYYNTGVLNCVLEMNGSTDYAEFYVEISDTSGDPAIQNDAYSVIGGYRIGD